MLFEIFESHITYFSMMVLGCCVCALLVFALPYETKDTVLVSNFIEAEESREESVYGSVEKAGRGIKDDFYPSISNLSDDFYPSRSNLPERGVKEDDYSIFSKHSFLSEISI